MRYRESNRERSSLVLISTIPRAAVCARKTRSDLLREADKGPSLKVRHGSFIRCPTNNGMESSLSRSYKFITNVKLSEEARNLAVILSISSSSMASGMCNVGNWLNTVILAGRQLLKLPDFPVHARMLVSPELVSSCPKSRPSAWSPSPYTTGKEMENMPSKYREYNPDSAGTRRVRCLVETHLDRSLVGEQRVNSWW